MPPLRYKGVVRDDDLREQIRKDRKLIERAAQALAEIDRSTGLSDEHADVLAALRIRIEGKERASLDDLLGAAGDVGAGRKDLGDLISPTDEQGTPSPEWPDPPPRKRDWPGL